MTLPPGTRLGPYEITASVGQGGMGQVYRARDTRLDRTVAIKIVGGALSLIDERALLEHEARAVAALNHPHICALHDVSRDRDTPFLVMEYVDGETLSSRLARGVLPVREVIRFGIQIAEALDHAHRNGVVHRDLKPANIMLTKSGVKVLDFGLATLRAAAPVPTPLDRTPVAAHQLTSERTLLGTIHYMSPERLEGREADAAADLFSFGAVLYEMATGRRPFESGSPAAVIAAILKTDPPAPSSLQPEVTPSLDWLIMKALAKSPDARWQSAADVVEILRWLAREPERAAAAPSRRRHLMPVAVAASVVATGAFLGLGFWLRDDTPSARPMTFSIFPPAAGGFTPTPSSVPSPQFALSPDGRRLAFVASAAQEPSRLWVRPLDSLVAEPVPGTHGAEYPFWSPDSAAIGFFASGSLKRVDLAGGPPRVLAAAAHGRGGTWSRTGTIVFAPNTQNGLFSIPAAGGEATPLTKVDPAQQEASHRWPQFLPDDRHFLYFVQGTTAEAHGIFVGSTDGATPVKIVSTGLSAAFVAPDRLLFLADDALMATGFDWRKARTFGEPVPIVAPVAGSSNFYAAFSASETGLLVYAGDAASSELVWVDRAGARVELAAPAAQYVDFRLSPHDQQLAIAEVDPLSHRPDIRVLDRARGAKLRLTYDSATDASPVWSPDGQKIVYRSNRSGLHDLYQKAANGTGPNSLLFQSRNAKYPTDWMPDGRGIIYHTYQRGTGSDILLMTPDGSQSTPLVQTTFDEAQGQVSSDGQWLAYTSLETGQTQVYIRSVSGAKHWQVSSNGGADPRWRGDGRELFYVSADRWLIAVDFSAGSPGRPKRLFEVNTLPAGNPYLSSYDVTTDGQRFLMKVPVQDVTSTPIHVIANWTAGR